MSSILYEKQILTLSNMFPDISLPIIAGPCAIESEEQAESVAKWLSEHGILLMRGGSYKPRTSPSSFQGLGLEGLKILDSVRKKYGLYVVSEIMDPRHIEYGIQYTDMIQVGSRNMTNYSLLKEIGYTRHPVLLKRSMMATIDEWIGAIEYIASGGNNQIILCERGIRSFDSRSRNFLDVFAIAEMKRCTGLSIIADVSHSIGHKENMLSMAKAAIAAGADGIMVEMHPNPNEALSDGFQQLDFNEGDQFIRKFNKWYLTLKNIERDEL